jgi:glycosyltransferase involved in cell wall biosynthesis
MTGIHGPTRGGRPVTDGSLRVLVAHPGAELFGSDRMVLESVAGFVEAGFDVVVTTPQDGPLLDRIRRLGGTIERCPTPVLRKSLLRPLGLLRLAGECLRGLIAGLRLLGRTRPDVLYVSTLTIPLWTLIGKVTRTPVVCHVHEAESAAPRWMRRLLSAPLLLTDRIIANSGFSAGVFGSVFPRLGDRTSVVYNGIAGPGSPAATRADLNGGLKLVYVGRLSERKGVDVAISALSLLKTRGIPARLDIVGSVFEGNEGYERSLREATRAKGLGDAVRFVGFVRDVWSAYAECDVAVVPSRQDEPFGNTAVEALLGARPVIVSDTSGLREASAGYGSALRVAPGDPQALAQALERVAVEWHRFRHAAQLDRVLAGRRHSPVHYRSRVAAIVGSVSRREVVSAQAVVLSHRLEGE